MIAKIRNTYNEYPRSFWVMMLGMFIDQLGGNIIFPFFALYITAKFNVSFTQVGLLLGTVTAGGIIGGLIGGNLADRFGRKKLMLFGLITSGLFSITIIFINRFEIFFAVALLAGLLGSLSGPASQAMLVDLLPEDKRTSGFGILRVVFNLTVAIGPLIGGLVSDRSYNWLFLGDAITSAIAFFIVLKLLEETKPVSNTQDEPEKIKKDGGYKKLLKDTDFILLLFFMMMTFAISMQMLSTLSVYMRDVHGFPNRYYGYILSLNAIMVVTLQFWTSRKVEKTPPMIGMIIGTAFSLVGFTIFGFIEGIYLFAFAMVILTIGEMIVDPLSQALTAKYAPSDMRGRYMAAHRFSMTISNLVTPYIAGRVFDSISPNWVWYGCGILGVIAIAGFTFLHFRLKKREPLQPAT